MKIKTQIQIAIAGALLLACYLFTGCASTGINSAVTTLETPATLQILAENGTYLALQKQPQLLQPLQAAVTGITNATAGGSIQLTGASLTGTLNQLGFGGLANLSGAPLLLDDLTAATTLYDAQQGTNSIGSNTNLIAALNAVAAGMERGIVIYKQ
jgi:hypothetical protein